MADWQSRPLEECIEQVVYTKKVQRKDFLAEGAYPVVSQEDAFVNGFWSLSGILCARHSMTTRSMNATQDEDRYGGQGGGAADSG